MSQQISKSYRYRYKNVGTTDLPKFGAMRITGYEKDSGRGLVLLAEEPDDTKSDPVAINANGSVAELSYGFCYLPPIAWADASETTNHADTLQTKLGNAGLIKGGEDYQQIGEEDADLDAVLVVRLGGGGGGSDSVIGMLTNTVPGSTGIDGTTFEVTPGTGGDVTLMEWDGPMLVAVRDDLNQPVTIQGVNISPMLVQASTDYPVMYSGTREDVNGVDSFVLASPFDIAGMPNFDIGTDAVLHAQGLFHPGADRLGKLDHGDCEQPPEAP